MILSMPKAILNGVNVKRRITNTYMMSMTISLPDIRFLSDMAMWFFTFVIV